MELSADFITVVVALPSSTGWKEEHVIVFRADSFLICSSRFSVSPAISGECRDVSAINTSPDKNPFSKSTKSTASATGDIFLRLHDEDAVCSSPGGPLDIPPSDIYFTLKHIRNRREKFVTRVVDAHSLGLLVDLLYSSGGFRERMHSIFLNEFGSAFNSGRRIIRLVASRNARNRLDYSWEKRLWTLVVRHELMKEHFAWLSTLGGAFSALGKIGFKPFAERAGLISMSQWRLAKQLDDPILAARCRIYFAISQIQKGDFQLARKILLNEKKLCRKEQVASEAEKLESIVDSVWQYLVYEERASSKDINEESVLEHRCNQLLYREETIRAKNKLTERILHISLVKI